MTQVTFSCKCCGQLSKATKNTNMAIAEVCRECWYECAMPREQGGGCVRRKEAKQLLDLAEAAQAVVDCRNASGSGNVRTYASFSEALDKLAAVLGEL